MSGAPAAARTRWRARRRIAPDDGSVPRRLALAGPLADAVGAGGRDAIWLRKLSAAEAARAAWAETVEPPARDHAVLEGRLDGAVVTLTGDWDAFAARADAAAPGLELTAIPGPDRRALALEAALAPALDALEAAARTRIRLDRLIRPGGDDRLLDALLGPEDMRAVGEDAAVLCIAATEAGAARSVAPGAGGWRLAGPRDLIERLYAAAATPTRRTVGEGRLGARIALRVGAARVALGALRRIEPGDALLVETAPRAEAALVACERLVAPASIDDAVAHARIEGRFAAAIASGTQEFIMSEQERAAETGTAAITTSDLDETPIQVLFEAARLEMTVAELRALSVGDAIDLRQAAEPRITIYAGGRKFATATLVEMDGRLAAEIESLAPGDAAR